MNIIQKICDGIWYCLHQYWIDEADQRTKHLPMFDNGLEIPLLLLLIYLIFVKIIGPWFMKNRKPFDLFLPMLLYDLFMTISNGIIFFSILLFHIDFGRRFLLFKFPDRNDYSIQTMNEINNGYLCYLTRWADLLDTVFFVLRKKQQQITFLHLYHHTLVPIIGWMVLKITPLAPVVILFFMINSFIHMIMYLYYALAAFGNRFRKYLWWKKFITQLQLIQFLIFGFYSIVMLFLAKGFPSFIFWLGFAQNPFFFYMFYDFYRKSYLNKNKQNSNSKR